MSKHDAEFERFEASFCETMLRGLQISGERLVRCELPPLRLRLRIRALDHVRFVGYKLNVPGAFESKADDDIPLGCGAL
jgi:hypothetical protein